jgi:uncharacterized membrane protein YuzA (DUF378 family)
MDPSSLYIQKKIYMILTLFVFIGGLNWLIVAGTGQDYLRSMLGFRMVRWIYLFVGISTLYLMFRRDVYLPFLGETVLPDGALMPKSPQGANQSVTITTRPGSKVVYWASEPDPALGKTLKAWNEAYQSYENSGVAVADDRGQALLRFRGPPQSYKVPFGVISPHVHFRVSEGNGLFGPVQILSLKDNSVEAFVDVL